MIDYAQDEVMKPYVDMVQWLSGTPQQPTAPPVAPPQTTPQVAPTTPQVNPPQGYVKTDGVYTHTTTNNAVDWDKYRQAIADSEKQFEQDYAPIRKTQDDYLAQLQQLRQRLDPVTTPQPKEQDARLAGYLMLSNAFNKLAGAVGEEAGNYNGRGLVKRQKFNTFANDYNNYLARRDAVEQAKALQAKKEMDNLLSDIKYKTNNDLAYIQAKNAYMNTANANALNKYTDTSKTTETWKSPETIANEKAKASKTRSSSHSSGGSYSGNGSYLISSPAYNQSKRFGRTPTQPLEKTWYNNRDLNLTGRQVEKMYDLLEPYILTCDKNETGLYRRGKTTKDKAELLDRFANTIWRNKPSQFTTTKDVATYFLAFANAYDNVVHNSRYTDGGFAKLPVPKVRRSKDAIKYEIINQALQDDEGR